MKKFLIWSGMVAAMAMSASAALAANPATANLTSSGSVFMRATRSIWFVNGNLQGSQPQSNAANATVEIASPFGGRNTNSYGASAQVRCNGSSQIFTKAFSYPTTKASIVCTGVGNAWAGTISIN